MPHNFILQHFPTRKRMKIWKTEKYEKNLATIKTWKNVKTWKPWKNTSADSSGLGSRDRRRATNAGTLARPVLERTLGAEKNCRRTLSSTRNWPGKKDFVGRQTSDTRQCMVPLTHFEANVQIWNFSKSTGSCENVSNCYLMYSKFHEVYNNVYKLQSTNKSNLPNVVKHIATRCP